MCDIDYDELDAQNGQADNPQVNTPDVGFEISSIEAQVIEWVKGNSNHNEERDECCPDFSCCGSPLADLEVRERFAKAFYEKDAHTIHKMLMMFLGTATMKMGVHIAGDEPGKKQ